MPGRLMTAAEAIAEFGIPSVRTLRTMRARGLPSVKLGKAHLFHSEDIAAFIQAAKIVTPPQAFRGAPVSAVPTMTAATAAAPAGRGGTVTSCTATDGDTIRCGDERIRLLGIDAPEMPGHCRRSRICAPGDPLASRRSLAAAMRPMMPIERLARDRYGRTIATVGGLSCHQLRTGQAIYRPAWDNGGRVRRTCPAAAVER